jgi:hypothetical protein
MVCLVGENPLPVYFGIMQFADITNASTIIVLVHSLETKPQAFHLRDVIRKVSGSKATLILRFLPDPFNPILVNGIMADLRIQFPQAALNYTGGTKVMAGFGLLNWRSSTGIDKPLFDDAFYLEEGKQRFHFGSHGQGVDLKEPLTLATLRRLHNLNQPESLSRREDLTIAELVNVFNQQRPLYMPFYMGTPRYQLLVKRQEKLSSGRKDKDIEYLNADIKDFEGNLLPDRQLAWHNMELPQDEYRYGGSEYEAIMKCASGGWFEQLIEHLVKGLHANEPDSRFDDLSAENADPLISPTEILANQTFPIKVGRWAATLEFESDLLVINRQRLRYISITTSRNFKTCKSKMFEATVRAQQLGGGMATSCVVCLGKVHYSRSLRKEVDFIDACRNALGNDPRNTIFGWDDVHKWVSGNTKSLRKFLTE